MATIDDVYNLQQLYFPELIQETHTGPFPPAGTRLKNTVNDINAHVNTLLAGVTVDPAVVAKIDALGTLLQHVSDGIDTLLDTLNGGAIDTKIGIIITKVSTIEGYTQRIGESGDVWSDGTHTVLGALNDALGSPSDL